MTTTQLKTISGTWMVRDGVIRPVNPYAHKRFERKNEQHAYATDLPPGTYRVEQLRVVWQLKEIDDSEWQNATYIQVDYAKTYDKFKELVGFFDDWETRLFITKNN